ncbi:hypothetical protein JHK82_012205 [Glycine max]|nr:hypothetical protein JHK85_012542 [Glycine max]KAG5057213.1 hypothetical protein JHK86_012209 [Glycine max]KAG5154236.1 hypothetical protein JHK82_012205 [Glycine max]
MDHILFSCQKSHKIWIFQGQQMHIFSNSRESLHLTEGIYGGYVIDVYSGMDNSRREVAPRRGVDWKEKRLPRPAVSKMDDIEKLVSKLEDKVRALEEGSCMDAIILPLHGSLPPELQAKRDLITPTFKLKRPQFLKYYKRSLSLEALRNLVPHIEALALSAMNSWGGDGQVINTFKEMKRWDSDSNSATEHHIGHIAEATNRPRRVSKKPTYLL